MDFGKRLRRSSNELGDGDEEQVHQPCEKCVGPSRHIAPQGGLLLVQILIHGRDAVDNARQVFERWMKWEPDDLAWAAYIKFEMRQGQVDRARAIYDKYVLQLPTARAYIKYASWEEKNHEFLRSRSVFERSLSELHPQAYVDKILADKFDYDTWFDYIRLEEAEPDNFDKIRAAHLEVRQKDLVAARKILGTAIGMCPGKENLLKGYISLEQQSIFELGLSQQEAGCEMDMPELVWKAYIDMEASEGQNTHVWISFATFESELPDRKADTEIVLIVLAAASGFDEEDGEDEGVADSAVEASRTIFSRGYDALKKAGLKEERMLLLEAWRDMEEKALDKAGGEPAMLQAVEAKMPRKIKMRREKEGGFMEEYFDYIFPDDEKKMVGLKILEKAMAWKKLAGAPSNPNPNAEELSIDDDEEDKIEVDGEEQGKLADAEAQAQEEEDGESMLGKRKADF
eukprot:gene23466-31815_t